MSLKFKEVPLKCNYTGLTKIFDFSVVNTFKLTADILDRKIDVIVNNNILYKIVQKYTMIGNTFLRLENKGVFTSLHYTYFLLTVYLVLVF